MTKSLVDQIEELTLFAKKADERAQQIDIVTRQIRRFAKEAIAENERWRVMVEERGRCTVEEAPGQERAAQFRVAQIHRARCNSLKALARVCRRAMKLAAGDLIIDESTAGTGLDTEERTMIADIHHGRGGE